MTIVAPTLRIRVIRNNSRPRKNRLWNALPDPATWSVQIVSGPNGASNALSFSVYAPYPVITSLDPSSRAAGSGAFTLTVNGTTFHQGSIVRWNGSNRTTTPICL